MNDLKIANTVARTIWQTKTFKGASAAGIAGIIISLTPSITDIAKRHNPKHVSDIGDISNIVLTVAGLFATGGAGAAILGRAAANDEVRSPRWMPGPNIEDAP